MGFHGSLGNRADRAGAASREASAAHAHGRYRQAFGRPLPAGDRHAASGPGQVQAVSQSGSTDHLWGIWPWRRWRGLSRFPRGRQVRRDFPPRIAIKADSANPFFFNDPATTEIYTLSLHDALPISLNLGLLLSAALYDPRKPPSVLSRTARSEEHTSELQSRRDLVCRLLLEKK